MILIIYIIYISKVTRLVIFLNMSARMFPSTGISNVNLEKKKNQHIHSATNPFDFYSFVNYTFLPFVGDG